MDLTLRRARLAVTITFITNGFTAGTFVARIPDFKKILDISNGTLTLYSLIEKKPLLTAIKNKQ